MIKKGVERTLMFKMVDNTDFATPKTGLSVTCEISKNGGAFTGTTNSATEIGNGWYKVALTDDEMDADEIVLKSTAASAAQSDRLILTEDNSNKDIYDRLGTPSGASVSDDIKRILGLSQENYYIDNVVFESSRLKSARLRIYSNGSNVGTDNDVIATYNVTATYDANGNIETYKVVKE